MVKENEIFRIYFSHIIRGKKGNKATDQEIQDNIDRAVWVGTQLKSYLLDWEKMDGFPKLDLYIPGEHDEFVQIAWKKKFINEEQILNVDCTILDRCRLIILYGDYLSKGMKIEFEHAKSNDISIFSMPSLSDLSVDSLKFAIKLICIAEGFMKGSDNENK